MGSERFSCKSRVSFAAYSLALLTLWFAPASSFAQAAPSRAAQAQYKDLIAKGLQEYQLGHWSEARVFFTDAHTLWPNARTFRGLGMTCYEARSYVEAIGFLEQALVNQTQPLTPKLSEEARNILDQARRFVSELRLELEPSSASVTLDDKPLSSRDHGPVLLDPGEHQLDVSAAGYRPVHRTVIAQGGQPVHAHVQLSSLRQEPERGEVSVGASDDSSSPFGGPVERKPEKAKRETRLVFAEQYPVAAAIVAGFGFASLAAGWSMMAFRNDARLTLWHEGLQVDASEVFYDPNVLQRYRLFGALAFAGVGLGSAMLSLAEYLWLPDHPGVPAWAWALGGVGVALVVTAIALAVAETHCEVTDTLAVCQQAVSDPYFAPLLAIPALPFLTLPLFYAVRDRMVVSELKVALLPGLSPGAGPQLMIRGSF
jgi:hypothetical protein